MAITNAQQVQQMQLVKKRKDGKRPGYYGPDAGHENDPGTGGKSNNNNSGGNKGSDKGHSRFASDSGYYGKKQGSTFETYRGGKNVGVDNKLASKYGTAAQKAKANKALAKGNLYSSGPNQSFFEKNSTFQKNKMVDLARKRAFQKYQDIEQYVDPFDDYSLTPETLAEEMAKNPAYGYDFSDLEKGKEQLGSNIGTSIESYRPNLYDVNPKTNYSAVQALLSATRPDTQVTALNTLNKARDYTDLVNKSDTLTNQQLRDEMTNLKNRGKTEDQINPPDRGNDQQDPCKGPNPPAYCFTGIRSAVEEPAEEESPQAIPYRLMNMGGDTEDAPLMAGAPELKLQGDVQPKQENMMMAEVDPFLMEEYEKYVFDMEEMGLQPMTFEEFKREAMSGMAGGGIAELRQGYFLGGITKSIKKAVKGATRAVKKVAKSPLGKAALFAGLGAYGLGAGPFSSGKFGAGFLKNPKFLEFMFKGGNPGFSNLTSKGLMAGVGALSALPLLGIGTGDDEEEGEQDRGESLDIAGIRRNPYLAMQRSGNPYRLMAEGGNAEPVAKDVMPLLDMGGKEKDYRETGGFVDMGRMEKADDVPARLSKNEFVFTADAVRNAGEGDIDKGAEVMYNMMKNLESGGEVSEDSQGLDGARAMFQTSQKLEGVM